jgi:putative FmdB family regulatory protein
MPLYEYQCDACGHRFEKIQKFSDSPIDECPKCGAKSVHKLVSSPAIQFKGSGWYITDYAKKGMTGADGSKVGEAKNSESKGADSKGGDTKTPATAPSESKSSESKASDSKPAASTATSTDK